MRKNGIDKLALLAVLGAAVAVALAAAGTGPAYSDDSGSEPVAVEGLLPAAEAATPTPAPAGEDQPQARSTDADGYQWSGSRPASDRYLWSQ